MQHEPKTIRTGTTPEAQARMARQAERLRAVTGAEMAALGGGRGPGVHVVPVAVDDIEVGDALLEYGCQVVAAVVWPEGGLGMTGRAGDGYLLGWFPDGRRKRVVVSRDTTTFVVRARVPGDLERPRGTVQRVRADELGLGDVLVHRPATVVALEHYEGTPVVASLRGADGDVYPYPMQPDTMVDVAAGAR